MISRLVLEFNYFIFLILIIRSFSFSYFADAAINFLLCTDATILSLSHTVGSVELPIAACSRLQAFRRRRSNAFLWPRSTNAPCDYLLMSDITSSYNCLKDGVILPMSFQFNNIILPHFRPWTITDLGVFRYWCLTRVALKVGRKALFEIFLT